MIKRPEGLSYIEVRLSFNFKVYTKLEIDLGHINKNARSNFSIEEVTNIMASALENNALLACDEKEFGTEICSYFVKKLIYKKNNYKLVFCICSDREDSIGVITLHRL